VPSRRSTWLAAGGVCAALLVLPLVVWLLVPRAGGAGVSPTARSAPVSAPVDLLPQTDESTPTERAPVAAPAAPVRAEQEPQPEAPVTGIVLDPDGNPVNRAFVECEDRDTDVTGVLTDAEGRFKLAPGAAGCNAVARHPDYSPSDGIRLAAGRVNTIRLSRGGAIAGNVVDERGSPVPSYTLAIESFLPKGDADLGRKGAPRKVDDATGAFLIDGLPPGRYVLSASAPARPPGRSDTVNVESGQTTSHVRIVLSRGALLSGTVFDADTRAPIAGATIRLDSVSSVGIDAVAPATSDEQGAFTLDGVPEGPFSVRVQRQGYRTKIVPALTTRGAQTLRTEIALAASGDGGGNSELTGIGAVLVPTPKGVAVAATVEGAPAAAAGIRKGDLIERIDGVSAAELTLSDCIQRLRGPEGSRVTVVVSREGQASVEITITRGTIVQ
jgi:hypothetical protein